jgi:hypothetical protein
MIALVAKLTVVVVDAIAKFVGDAEGRPASEVRKAILDELTQTDKDLADAEAAEDAARRG